MSEPGATTAASWFTPRRIVVMLVAGAVGLGVGFLVDVASPNPVYGFQLIADVVAIGLIVIAALIPGRRLLAVAVGLAIGIIAGIAVGLNVVQAPSLIRAATIEVELEQPAIGWPAGSGRCRAEGDRLLYLDTEATTLNLPADRRLVITIADGSYDPIGAAPQETGLGMVASVFTTNPDGPATVTLMGSSPSSTLTLTGTASSGTLAFSGLELMAESELREPFEIAGTVQWSCPAT